MVFWAQLYSLEDCKIRNPVSRCPSEVPLVFGEPPYSLEVGEL